MALQIFACIVVSTALVMLVGCDVTEDDVSLNTTNRNGWKPPPEASCYAEIYQHDNFGGWRAVFPTGRHDFHMFLRGGARNDDASSIRVIGSGCKAIVYQHAGFKGWEAEFTTGAYRMREFMAHGAKNDDASSVIVMQDPMHTTTHSTTTTTHTTTHTTTLTMTTTSTEDNTTTNTTTLTMTTPPTTSTIPNVTCHQTTFTCDAIFGGRETTECFLDYDELPQEHCPVDTTSWGREPQCYHSGRGRPHRGMTTTEPKRTNAPANCDEFVAFGYCGCASCASMASECRHECGFDHPLPVPVGTARYSLELGPYHSLGCA